MEDNADRTGVLRIGTEAHGCIRGRAARVSLGRRKAPQNRLDRAIFGAVERPFDRLAFYVAVYTALRAGELWALNDRTSTCLARRLHIGRTLVSTGTE